jgi:hypothetical protein
MCAPILNQKGGGVRTSPMTKLSDESRAIIMCYNLTQNKTMTLERLAGILLDEIKARGLEDLVCEVFCND